MMVTYFPIALITTIFFVLVNSLLLPVAYLKSLLHKLLIAFKLKEKEALIDLLKFLVYGYFILAVGQIYEAKYFF